MVGRTLSHYRLLELIGGGGMGVVYRAEDLKLTRQVALKFLPPELSRDPEAKKRFLAEAQTLSTLQHNNICTLHDIDEAEDGQIFMVMDLYEGITLREKIERGPLRTSEATGIAIQIAQGLARAHEKGIFHRDIKPANILITSDGTAKILDFGLAKFAGRAMLTREGTTVGTTAYMSPEQTRGEAVDARTDLWALGVILYQMVSGRLPFGSEHEQAVIYNIQHAEPVPIANAALELPDSIGRIIAKSLQKDPGGRYQSGAEFAVDLDAARSGLPPSRLYIPGAAISTSAKRNRFVLIGTAIVVCVLVAWYLFSGRGALQSSAEDGRGAPMRRLAVLPFTNLRSNPDTDFLGFALADQIIGNLTYVKTLLVRPSMAVRQFQNQTVDPVTAGKSLNVDFILTGNYLKESENVRLTVELVDVRSNGIVWRDAMQESYVDAFKLEDLVAEKVVSGLRLQFSPEEAKHMQADAPKNSRAYELFLRALSNPTSAEGHRNAVDLVRQSIALDSMFAPAYNELGYRLQQMANYVLGEQRQTYAAVQAYQKAIDLNGELLSAVAGLSSIYTDIGKTEEAFELARRAVAINPNNSEGHFFLGYVERYAGLLDEAREEQEKAVAMDPKNLRFRSIGITYCYLKEYDKALEGFALDPGSGFMFSWKAYAYMRMGAREKAIAYCDSTLAVSTGSVTTMSSGALRSYLLGERAKGIAQVRDWEKISTIDGEQAFVISTLAAALRDTDGCIRSLKKAIEGGFFCYPVMRDDPLFNPFRSNPAFMELVEQARAKHEAFKARVHLIPPPGQARST